MKNKYIINKLSAVKNLIVSRSPDAYIISFPKSGRTWLTMILAKLLSLHYKIPFDFKCVITVFRRGAPMLKFSHGYGFRDMPQIIKFYQDREWDGKKLILLFRDPRDTVVSYYHHMVAHGDEAKSYKQTMSDFIHSNELGINRIIDFMNLWVVEAKKDGNLVIYYEDLHSRQHETIQSIAEYLNIPASKKEIDSAIEFSTFENMRKMEIQDKSFAQNPRRTNDVNTYRTRKGKVGSYQEELSKEDLEFINNEIDNKLDNYFSRYKKDR